MVILIPDSCRWRLSTLCPQETDDIRECYGSFVIIKLPSDFQVDCLWLGQGLYRSRGKAYRTAGADSENCGVPTDRKMVVSDPGPGSLAQVNVSCPELPGIALTLFERVLE